ncbi:TRAP transporter substrate-binding protein [Butyrivibrio sp. INlla21]|uniref:TRAP transporter substrate-binding protein n=1 Tax=Butyrivibrio sp. INlla21 TaxID=1520811 RepID=UPI0008DF2A27|nr:TRAP transporter substrate-binding protein [Butyrivibrio sp. INlla21]SFU83113.1 tripartite ATP-independent transporter solute receptor, DctP family [Butyrivibrio sp. INlla21]
MAFRRMKIVCAVLTGAATALLSACSGIVLDQSIGSEPEIILRYAEVNPSDHIITRTGKYFADRVKEMSDGRIEIEIYDAGKLGNDAQYYEQLRIGALDMYRGNAIALEGISNMEVGVMAMPYLFRDNDHFWKVCDGEIGKEVLADIQESGSNMVGLCFLDEGARNIMTVDAPIKDISDLKGLKIRSMEDELLCDVIRATGAEPVVMDYADVYSALQSGAVDGAENPVCSYYSNQFYKVAPYYTVDAHTHSPSVILISEITWKHLSDEDKNILLTAAEMAKEYNKAEIEDAESNAYNKLIKEKVKITKIDDISKWQEAMEPVYEAYAGNHRLLIDKIKNLR